MYLWRILDNARVDKAAPEYSRLCVVHTLFTGELKKEDVNSDTSAISGKGICCYYRMLSEPSREARVAARISVIPGTIESGTQCYSRLIDIQKNSFSQFQNVAEFTKAEARPAYCVRPATLELAKSCVPNRKMKLLVHEHMGESVSSTPALEVGFEIPKDKGSLQYVGPAIAIDMITRGTGLTTVCRHRLNHDEDDIVASLKLSLPLGSPQSACIQMEYGGTEITVFRGDVPTALVAACGCWLPIFVDSDSCVACAIYTGVSRSWKNFGIVCSEESWRQVRPQSC